MGALRRRLILELQDSFSRHPVYQKIVDSIQNRYAFKERPQFGIVVKGSSGSKVQLSGDNFIGTVQSHVMLAYVGQPTFPLEWVREDLAVVPENGAFPTAPGVYYLEILEAPASPSESGFFAVDPLLTVYDEPLLQIQSGIEREAQLSAVPIQGTLRLYENRRFPLVEGEHYTADYETGRIELLTAHALNSSITADYRYAAPSVGPVEFRWNTSNSSVLPGVVLAFGKRAKAGDKVAVVVYPDRVDTANAYGGKFEASFDLDVITRDSIQVEEIADLVFMYLWAQKKGLLENEGIEVLDVAMGGEAEEVVDETGDNYSYQITMSVQLRADWELHVPLPLTISRVTPVLTSVASNLYFESYPVMVYRNNDFERIG